MLERLDVNVADLRNFDKILFSNGHTEDADVEDFKKYFIAWCFKLQTPTTYRDFVTLQRSIDRLHEATDRLQNEELRNQQNEMKRSIEALSSQQNEMNKTIKDIFEMQKGLKQSLEQLRTDIVVNAATAEI